MRQILHKAVQQGLLRTFDLQLALFLARLAPESGQCPELLACTALVSHAVSGGHVCLPLETVAGKIIFKGIGSQRLPELASLRRLLLGSASVGLPGERCPLILDEQNRLYFGRYFEHQETIRQNLLRLNQGIDTVDTAKALVLLDRLFPKHSRPDLQRLAASLALFKRLVIISGGPGTGKTHTVARILALLNTMAPTSLRIGLTAPTGKAANRLQESISRAKEQLDPDLADTIPDKTLTLHRLLGARSNSPDFRHNRNNPLPLDLLVLDEASMVDVVLMARLLEALPDTARLIILGDRDQLASVEAGSLFADLCGPVASFHCSDTLYSLLKPLNPHLEKNPRELGPFADSVIRLGKSYRFRRESCIGELAAAVNDGDQRQVADILGTGRNNFSFVDLTGLDIKLLFRQHYFPHFQAVAEAEDPASALERLNSFRILCALRDGPYGVRTMNSLVEQVLVRKNLIPGNVRWYKGRPIMIRSNHYGLHLFNGDTGILWPDENNVLLAWFVRSDGSLFPVAPSRLPDHETAYAVTVHKSQGSEFDQVMMLLPPEEHILITRELIYTGITRAREKLTVLGETVALQASLEKRTIRHSGLFEGLWNF